MSAIYLIAMALYIIVYSDPSTEAATPFSVRVSIKTFVAQHNSYGYYIFVNSFFFVNIDPTCKNDLYSIKLTIYHFHERY